MAGILIKAFETGIVNKIGDFFKGKAQIEPSLLFNIFSLAAKKGSEVADKSTNYKFAATPLRFLSQYLAELSTDLNKFGGSGIIVSTSGGALSRRNARLEKRKAKQLERQKIKIQHRQEAQIARIEKRQNVRAARQKAKLTADASIEQLASELGIDSQVNTLLGWLGGHGAIKPAEIFSTIGQLVDVVSDSIAKVDSSLGSKVSNYGTDFMTEAENIDTMESNVQDNESAAQPIASQVEGSGPGISGSTVKRRDVRNAYRSCVTNLQDKGYKRKSAKALCGKASSNLVSAIGSYDPGVKYDTLERVNLGGSGCHQRARGTRLQVWDGHAKRTSGGLTKADLMIKNGKIVSKRQNRKHTR